MKDKFQAVDGCSRLFHKKLKPKTMSYKRRSMDPRQMTSRFASTCYTCNKLIKKGEEIIYWPNGNHAVHLACGEADYRRSLASFEDEENYNNQYPSW